MITILIIEVVIAIAAMIFTTPRHLVAGTIILSVALGSIIATVVIGWGIGGTELRQERGVNER